MNFFQDIYEICKKGFLASEIANFCWTSEKGKAAALILLSMVKNVA